MNIDSHQHFWHYAPDTHDWITDDMAMLKRDFLPPDLQPLLEQNGLDGCVAVQASQTEQETEFLLDLAGRYDFIRGVVGWVDLQDGRVEARLAHYAQFNKLVGIRHMVQSEPDEYFLTRPEFLRGVALLQQYGLAYDLLIVRAATAGRHSVRSAATSNPNCARPYRQTKHCGTRTLALERKHPVAGILPQRILQTVGPGDRSGLVGVATRRHNSVPRRGSRSLWPESTDVWLRLAGLSVSGTVPAGLYVD